MTLERKTKCDCGVCAKTPRSRLLRWMPGYMKCGHKRKDYLKPGPCGGGTQNMICAKCGYRWSEMPMGTFGQKGSQGIGWGFSVKR